MKRLHRWSLVSLLLSSFLFTHSAMALQFVYNSKELPFLQGFLAGEPDETVGSDDQPYPSFSVSFFGTGNSPINTFLSGDIRIGQAEYPFLLEHVPATNSSLTLNEDGSVAAWNFSLAISKTIPQTIDSPPDLQRWLVESSYGPNTCNCDRYRADYDLYIQRQDSWQYVNTLGVLFGSEDQGNWSFNTSEVPEPNTLLLLLGGLTIVRGARLRKSILNGA